MSKRTMVCINPELHNPIKEWAKLTGASMTEVVNAMLVDQTPTLHKRIAEWKEANGVGKAINQFH